MELIAAYILAVLLVHHVGCSPCKPQLDQVCSCKQGQLSSEETCTVCACSHDGNIGQCSTSQWLNISTPWIVEESSGSSTVDFAENMFDGDPATVWEPLGQPEGYQHWVIVDLQTSFRIHRVTIANNGDGVHDVVSFSMESSTSSPYVWETAYSSAEVLSGIPMPQYFTPEFVGRYLRFKVNTQSGVRPSVREVSLYGKVTRLEKQRPLVNRTVMSPPAFTKDYEALPIHCKYIVLEMFTCTVISWSTVMRTMREHNQTTPEKVMDELLPRGTTTNNVHLSIAPKTLPLGVHMIQFQVVMNVTGRGHVSVSVVQTFVEFIRVPVVYSLGSAVRTVLTDEVTSRLGCWVDDAAPRAIPGLEGLDPILDGDYWLRTDAIKKCQEAAVSRGYEVFAVQNGGWCGSSVNAKQTYKMYGVSTACRADGEGGPGANEVYLVTQGLLPTAGFTYNWSCRVTQLSAATACASVRGKYMQDPSWIVSSSGTPWVVNGVTHDAGKLFDGNPETFWNPLYTPRHSTDRNIVLDFRLPCTVSKVAWNNYGDVVHDMSAFKLQKSQVGSPYTWEDVVSVTNIPVGTNQRRVFGGFQGKARYWRFVITRSPYGWQPYLRELQLRVSPDPSTMEPIDIPEGFNVAEGRSASTNYLINSKAPEKAVDGNTNPYMGQGSCMRTILDQPDPWLKIDLCHQFSINRVVLYNRMDRDPERINPFHLHLGNAPEVVNNPTWGGDLNFDPAQFVTKTIPVESCVLLGCWRVDSSHPGMLVFDSPLDYGLHDLIPAVPRPAGLVADVSVDITAGDLPPVTLHTAIHLTPDYTLSGLDLHCKENCDPWKTMSTKPLSLYTDSEIFGTTEFSLVEFPAEFPGQQWTSGIDNVTSDRLRVLGGTFWAEGYYTIRLTDHHTADCGDLSRVAEWRFHVYPPPAPPVVPGDDGRSTGPVCTLQPADGVSLIDQFCVACPGFLDILGPVEVSIRFQLTPEGELATTTFPGDGPAGDNRIFLSASSRLWLSSGCDGCFHSGYTPLFDLAVGTIQLFVRADSVDGRFFEFNLAPIEIRPPTVSQLQSYLDIFFAHPGGVFFRQLALGDSESAYKGAILASAAAGGLAFTGYDVLETSSLE
ncbi:hypothetical protein Bbelb_129750 [Branchiostoma belcheri]|nr:hypothetical protein Bbelb_129750 [Branchiostoma belcheri]